MARKLRVEYVGAFYHVICRGNQRQVIFRSDADRKHYLERLEHYRQRYGFNVYAYVLMSNHVHLLIETGKVHLSKIMQGLQFRYTGYYNRKYNKVGHLFQGRYKPSCVTERRICWSWCVIYISIRDECGLPWTRGGIYGAAMRHTWARIA
jgi:REP element-mobilizing transposase RayT